jgi:hypothetical protein
MFAAGGAARLPPAGGAVDNLLLLSMLAATVVVPAAAARAADGRRALAWTFAALAAFTAVYVVLVTQYYAVHYVPEPFAP